MEAAAGKQGNFSENRANTKLLSHTDKWNIGVDSGVDSRVYLQPGGAGVTGVPPD